MKAPLATVLLAAASPIPAFGQYIQQELIPAPGTDVSRFGAALSINANHILVGSPGPNGDSAHLFDAATGAFIQQLLPGGPTENFGASVALAGDVAIVADTVGSAPPLGGNVRGFDVVTGNLLWTIEGTRFLGALGRGLAASANTVLVSDAGGFDDPLAHLLDAATGAILHTFVPPAGGSFGDSVALSQDWIAIADKDDSQAGSSAGTVYVYDATTGSLVSQLLPTTPSPVEQFGSSIDLDGDLLVVGSPFHQLQGVAAGLAPGRLSVYDLGTLSLLGEVVPAAPELQEWMGRSVRISDSFLVASSSSSNLAPGNFGSQHIFDRTTLEPVGQVTRFAPLPSFQVYIVDAYGDRMVVGEPKNSSLEIGRVFVYSLGNDAPGQSFCGPAVPNSTGLAANIQLSWGGDLTQGNYLYLLTENVPAQEFGYYLGSQTPAFVPGAGGSQGNLCVGGAVRRLITGTVNLPAYLGTMPLALNLSNVPGGPPASISAGDTWFFQLWYRDAGSSNFSEGWQITF